MSVAVNRSALARGKTTGFFALERHVRSLERSIDFYVRGLGFTCERHHGEHALAADVILTLGQERIALSAVENAEEVIAQVPGPDVRFQHLAIVTRDMSMAVQRLQVLAPIPITRGRPQRLPRASGGATAFKFRDPDGHPLELIEFATGQCPDRWRHRAGNDETLGIDHAAISVSRVEQSIGFYCGLGFSVQTRQVNRGVEQGRLDGLDELEDVEVEVVALVASGPPSVHLELLAYAKPAAFGQRRDKRAPSRAADCLTWFGAPSMTCFADPDGHVNRVIARPP